LQKIQARAARFNNVSNIKRK